MRDLISLTIRYTPEDYVRAIRFIRYRNPLVKYAFLFPILMFPVIAGVMYFVNPQSMAN